MVGFRRSVFGRLLVSATLLSGAAYAQTTGNGDLIGYVVEDGTPVTSIYCPTASNELRERNGYMYCNFFGIYTGEVGVGCDDRTSWIYSSSGGSWTRDCGSWDCVTATLYDDLSDDSDSKLFIGCENSLGLTATQVDALYITATGGDGEDPTGTTSESDRDNGPTTTDADGNDDDNNNNDDDGSPDVATIVGAVVGSVVGVALIIGAFFIGYRMGKKKGGDPNAAAKGKGGFGRPSIVWTRQDDPTQTQSVPLQQDKTATPTTIPVSSVSPPVGTYPGGYAMMTPQQQQQMQQQPQQGYGMPHNPHHSMQPPPQGYSPQPQQMQQGYPPQVPQEYGSHTATPPPHSELGVGPEHQGFATSDAHPHSYEMYSSPAPPNQGPR